MKIELGKDGARAVIDTIGACVDSLTIGGEQCVIDKRGTGGGIDAVLFPIVGRQNGGDYTVDGKVFKLPIHGLLKGVEMTEAELMKVFDKHGITKMDVLGKHFDPNFHQVIQEVEDKTKPNGTVIAELQTGYMINDRILREAMVVVSKGGE